MTKPRILFLTDRSEFHQQQALRDAPPELGVIMRRRPSSDELNEILPTVQFIISERTEIVSRAMIERASNLKLIVRLGSLLVGIDTEAAREKKIKVVLQPVVGTIYVAEHILMMTLATLKHLGRSLWQANAAEHGKPARRTDENNFAFNWLGIGDIGRLYQKTIGIIGMGEIGVEFTRRSLGFAPTAMLYHKRIPYPADIEQTLALTYAEISEIAERADVVISLLPYSTETDRSINEAFFDRMKPGAILVHAGSGSVIDETALLDALKVGKLAGAALDTYEYEPLQPDHALVRYARDPNSNLLLTPHTAGASLPASRAGDYAEIVRYMKDNAI